LDDAVIDAGIFLICVQRIPLRRRPTGRIVSLDERTRKAGIGIAARRAREGGMCCYEQQQSRCQRAALFFVIDFIQQSPLK